MSNDGRPNCPACGEALSADATEDLCAKCVMEVMMKFDASQDETIAQDYDYIDPDIPLGEIGDYELLEKIASGGMGVVYRARQKRLRRLVALKLVIEGKLASNTDKERFLIEARAAGELDHPNIVPIYEVGEDDGQHFFSMRLVTGGSLADRFAEYAFVATDKTATIASSAFRERQMGSVKLLIKISRAVHYAHEQGILHRDLKPANILIDRHGEPQISDFGLAKRVEEETHLTASGQLLGSPAYMSPEQAQGKNHELTSAADTYAIGVMLYQALAGRIPFDGDSPMALLNETLTAEPKALRKINPRIDRDLEIIALCCLEKSPNDRYASAEALAMDLENWLEGRPIHAKPAGSLRRMVKWTRRKPALTAMMILSLIGCCIFAGITLRHRQEQTTLTRAPYAREIRLAHERVAGHRMKEARAILEKHAHDQREFTWQWLWNQTGDYQSLTLPSESIHSLSAIPGATNQLLVQTTTGEVKRWNLPEDTTETVFTLGMPPESLHFHGGNHFLLAQREASDYRLTLPKAAGPRTGNLARNLIPPEGGFLAAAPGERPTRFVTTGGKRGDPVFTWKSPWKEGYERFRLGDDLLAVAISSLSTKQRHYVAFVYRTKLELWQWEDDVFHREATIDKTPSPTATLAFFPNRQMIVVGDHSGMVRVWNRNSLNINLEHQHGHAIHALTILTGEVGQYLIAAADVTGEIRVWEPKPPKPRPMLKNIAQPFTVHDEGVTAMKDGLVSEWTLDDSVYPRSPLPADSEVIALSLLNASSHQYAIVSKNPDGSLQLFHHHKNTWNLRSQLSVREGWIDQYVTGHHWVVLFENEATIVDLRTGESVVRKPPSAFLGKKLRIFGSDPAFFTYMEGHTIVMEDIQGTGTRRVQVEGDSAIEHYAISPDQQTVAAAHADGTLRLWHAESGNLLLELLNQPWEDLAFSPKSTILFGYERSGALHYWDARSTPLTTSP